MTPPVFLSKLSQLSEKLDNQEPSKIFQSVECQTNSLYRGDASTNTDFPIDRRTATPVRSDRASMSRSNSGTKSSKNYASDDTTCRKNSNSSLEEEEDKDLEQLEQQDHQNQIRPHQPLNFKNSNQLHHFPHIQPEESLVNSIQSQMTLGTSHLSPQMGDSATNFIPLRKQDMYQENASEDYDENLGASLTESIDAEAKDAIYTDVINQVGMALQQDQANLEPKSAKNLEHEHEISPVSNTKSNATHPETASTNSPTTTLTNKSNSDKSAKLVLSKTKQRLAELGIEFDPKTGEIQMPMAKPRQAEIDYVMSPTIPKLNMPSISQHFPQPNFEQPMPNLGQNIGPMGPNASLHVNALAMKYFQNQQNQNSNVRNFSGQSHDSDAENKPPEITPRTALKKVKFAAVHENNLENHSPDMSLATRAYFEKYGLMDDHAGGAGDC